MGYFWDNFERLLGYFWETFGILLGYFFVILGDLGQLMTSSGLSEDYNMIFKFSSKRLTLIALALFSIIVMPPAGWHTIQSAQGLAWHKSHRGELIGAKANLYCEAIELVCGGSPKICFLVERKSQYRVKSEG